MEMTQEHMDAYTLGATRDGLVDWAEREDAAGVQAVLNLIDPVPAEMTTIIDQGGDRWQRSVYDAMVWHCRTADIDSLTAHGIEQLYGIKEWSAE